MNRILLSDIEECHSTCLYCFSEDIQTDGGLKVVNKLKSVINDETEKSMIIYPSCDSDCNGLLENFEVLLSLIKKKDIFIIFGISVKGSMTEEKIKAIYDADRKLRNMKKGFFRVAISFSTKYRVDEIEPGTLSYDLRIKLMKRLKKYEIETSVFLKPILPFISTSEYNEIINDTITFSNKLLLGGLYYQDNSFFSNEYLREYKHISTLREVSWLPNKPKWRHIIDTEKMNSIYRYGNSKGFQVYDSDEKLLEDMYGDWRTKP